MAGFADPALKQIVDDLNAKNPDNTQPLRVEQCILGAPTPDTSHGGETNTRAQLTVVADGYYPAGTFDVWYRRLNLATLTQLFTTNVEFPGAEEQDKTLTEVVKKFTPVLATYLTPDLVDEGPYHISRDPLTIPLTAKSDSKNFIGSVALSTTSARIPIDNFNAPLQYTFYTASDTPLPAGADVDQDIINRIFMANATKMPVGMPMVPPNKSEVIMEYIPITDSNGGFGIETTVKLTMKPESTVFTGTRTFTYARKNAQTVFPGTGQFTAANITTDQQDMRLATLELFSTNNLLAPKLLPDMGQVNPEYLANSRSMGVVFDNTDPYYSAGGYSGALWMKITPITVIPYEAIFDFTVTDQFQPSVYGSTQQAGYQGIPTQMEVLSAPAGFLDSTIQIVNNKPGVTLPVGSYKVRLFAPDASLIRNPTYPTLVAGITFDTSMRITKVYKLSGLDLNSTFRFGWVNAVDKDVFNHPYAHAIWNLQYCFADCAITDVPAGIFDGLTRCCRFDNAFDGNATLTSVPTLLFNNQKAVYGINRTLTEIFKETGIVTLPSNLMKDVQGFDFYYAFSAMSALTTIPGDLFGGTFRVAPGWQYNANLNTNQIFGFERTFSECPQLLGVPGALFNAVRNSPYTVNFNYTFFRCPLLVDVGLGLFANIKPFSMYVETASTPVYEFHYTFADCAALQSIPSDFWYNVELRYPGGTFSGTGLTGIPSSLLRDQPYLRYTVGLFSRTKITSIPATLFQNSKDQMKSVSSMFAECSLLASVPAGLFSNMPGLLTADQVFAGCAALTSVPDDMFVGSPQLASVYMAFARSGVQRMNRALFVPFAASLRNASSLCYNSPGLTTVEAQLFDGNTVMDSAYSMFQSCTSLTSVGGRIFGSSNTAMRVCTSMFQQCSALTSIPVDLLAGITTIENVDSMFRLTGLTAIPSGFFDDTAAKLTNVGSLAADSASLVSIPTGLFANCNALTSCYQTFQGTGVVNPPVGIFPANNVLPIRMGRVFYNSAVKNIPAGFFSPKNIIELDSAFQACPLESVGAGIVQNELATGLSCNAMFGDYGGVNKQNFTIANNVITSTIPLTLTGGMGPGQGIFGSNNLITASIDNLFGSNIRIGSTSFLGTNVPNALTGNGTNFIAKHQVESATYKQGLFYNATSLSDYASLPTWAKNWPS